MNEHNTGSNENTIYRLIIEDLRSNWFSMLLETLVMVAVLSYAVMEIKALRQEFSAKMDHGFEQTSSFAKLQAQKIDELTDQVQQMSETLTVILGEKAKEMLEQTGEDNEAVKDSKEQAESTLKSWLEKIKGKPDEEKEDNPDQ